MIDQTPATAIVQRGCADFWPPHKKPPDYSLGLAFREGSWPVLRQATIPPADATTLVLHPNPDVGFVQDNPGRFGSIPEWQAKLTPVTGWFLRELRQWAADLQARNVALRPLQIRWNAKWRTPGGTQAQSADNGVIVARPDGTRYEIQGLARLNDDISGRAMIAAINARSGGEARATVGHYRCDAITLVDSSTKPHGSQGPKFKTDGLIGPRFFREFIPTFEARLVLPNVEFGPLARAVPPGWVEHPLPGQPYADTGGVVYPEGPHPSMVPSFTGAYLDWTDANIEGWIERCALKEGRRPAVDDARRWGARNLRGWATDADRPATPRTRIRVSETGSGSMQLESEGDLDPVTAAEWAQLGITADVALVVFRDIFRSARLVISAGLEAPA